MKKLTRSEFFRIFLPLVAVFGLGHWISACSDNGGGSDDGGDGGGGGNTLQPDCLNAGTVVAISANHGHTLVVSKAAVAAGVEETYSITGSAGHAHSVTITASHFASLAANQQVVITSTPADGAGHTHNVTVSCALA